MVLRRVLRLTACVSLLVGVARGAWPEAATGQIIRGVVVDSRDRTPLAAVLVTLVDGEGRHRQRFLVDADGAFRFVVPAPGQYALRAERMGTATRTIAGLDVAGTDTVVVRLPLEARAVTLAGIDVTTERRCVLRDDAGAATQQVWEEARKALGSMSHTDSVGWYRYELRWHRRELDAGSLLVRREVSSTRAVSSRRPIRSRPVESLLDSGFVRQSRDGDHYFAPDADVLLSDEFLATHCFGLRAGSGDQEGMIGLEFRPQTATRRATDVSGVLWLSRADGALEFMEFGYINLPEPARSVASADVGGRVAFERMPDGSWIVSDWHIRMPRVEASRDDVFGVTRPRLVGLVEEGGRVQRAWRLGRRGLVFADRTGAIAGQVASLPPGAGARANVRVLGLGAETAVGTDGRFRFDELPPGNYELSYVRPELLGLDRRFAVATVAVRAGETASVSVRPPPYEAVLAQACGVSAWVRETAVLKGEVIEQSTGIAVPGADVTVLWQVLTRGDLRSGVLGTEYQISVVTDADGSFLVCGVPVERELHVTARLGTHSTATFTALVTSAQPAGRVLLDMARR